jgi:hypothetical protein
MFFFQKAEAQLAYELQAAKIQQKIRNEEIQIQVIILWFDYLYRQFCLWCEASLKSKKKLSKNHLSGLLTLVQITF